MRLVILGGGGFRVPLVHRALAGRIRSGALDVDELVLYDIDSERLGVIGSVLPETPGLRVRTTTDLPDAMTGADVVFSAIRVGGAAGRVRDERRALDLGLLGQETVGAGGLSYALRTLPVVLDAARLQARIAPDAWLINFTNPAGLITEALTGVLGRRVIGICDSPIGLIRRSVRALGLDPALIDADYVGINHLGWLRALHHDGRDLLPDLLADRAAVEGFEEGALFGAPVLQALGAIPNEYLYFFAESRALAAQLAGTDTRGEVLAAQQQRFYADAVGAPDRAAQLWEAARRSREETYLAEARQEERAEEDLEGGGYEHVALDLMAALTGGPAVEMIVNAPNGRAAGVTGAACAQNRHGGRAFEQADSQNTVSVATAISAAGAHSRIGDRAIAELPADMVIETRCRVNGSGASPLPVAPLELYQLGMMTSVRAAERKIIDAVVHRSRDAALAGFALHPLVGSWDLAARLVDSVIADEPTVRELLA
ncbi:6-phospho-beta-glucosidase [Nakamurella sp. YIM 132087]|uniref:6-phospho-beta-glucosidase n=1 Tax=Nakamurella alba TaxID=2665158 RepID=A0A7K1FK38_9ACTN|nr:6-phospho-beta-glucosidase [Nakamurella alba]MTD13789.1 6-phospho-beta-glucosidase [Nakamurella alba]